MTETERRARTRVCAFGHRWLEFRKRLRACPTCGSVQVREVDRAA